MYMKGRLYIIVVRRLVSLTPYSGHQGKLQVTENSQALQIMSNMMETSARKIKLQYILRNRVFVFLFKLFFNFAWGGNMSVCVHNWIKIAVSYSSKIVCQFMDTPKKCSQTEEWNNSTIKFRHLGNLALNSDIKLSSVETPSTKTQCLPHIHCVGIRSPHLHLGHQLRRSTYTLFQQAWKC